MIFHFKFLSNLSIGKGGTFMVNPERLLASLQRCPPHKRKAHLFTTFWRRFQWWACSSLMSTPLPAEACCETCERIVLLWV